MEEVTKIINEFMVKFINVYSIKITEELLDNDQNKQERIISIGNELLNRNDWANKEEKTNEVISRPQSRKSSEVEKLCIHKWTRGNHIPGTLCGAKASKDSSYCCVHRKNSNKTTSLNNASKKPIPKGIIIKEHSRLKKFWHSETRMIFEIIENKKMVIARLSKKKNTLKSLREKDLDVCKCYGFLFCVKSQEELLKIENPINIADDIFKSEIPTDIIPVKILEDIPVVSNSVFDENKDIHEFLQEIKEK